MDLHLICQYQIKELDTKRCTSISHVLVQPPYQAIKWKYFHMFYIFRPTCVASWGHYFIKIKKKEKKSGPLQSHSPGFLYFQRPAKFLASLTLYVPRNSEWVASPGPSNTGAKRSKVGVGQEKPDKNAHISTVNFSVLPSHSATILLSSSSIYSESSNHSSSQSSTLCSLWSSKKFMNPILQQSNIFLD